MFEVQVRFPKAATLLIAFLLYAAIVISHPFAHNHIEHQGQNHQECSICLWLHNNTLDVSTVIPLLVFFVLFYSAALFYPVTPVRFYLLAQSSRAPPFFSITNFLNI